MIEFSRLCAGYGGKTVLHDISLSCPRGQVTVILGPTGCGKSTLLKTLPGLARIHSGSVTVAGTPLEGYDSTALARQAAFLPQTRRVPEMTVEQLVLHGRFPWLRYPRRYAPRDWAIAREVMEELSLTEYAHSPLETLSGGTRQRAYLAMALAQETDAILLDEPNAYLDIAHSLRLMELCRDLAARGKAVVMVLHDLNLALPYAHQVAVLSRGNLLAVGAPEDQKVLRALEQAFDVSIQRYPTPGGVFYHCRAREEEKQCPYSPCL